MSRNIYLSLSGTSLASEQVIIEDSDAGLGLYSSNGGNYIHDSEKIRYYGPVAQDFFQAFSHDELDTIGTETTLCGSDVAGINMIAIQALEKRTTELMANNEQLEKLSIELNEINMRILSENEKLKTELGELKHLVAGLIERIKPDDIRVTELK